MSNQDLAGLEGSLRRRFRVVETTVVVGGRRVDILHPASAEDLIDEADFALDERLRRQEGAGRTLIELGCGSGLVATCASLSGFEVVVSDYYEDATRFARVNAWRNHAPVPNALVLDWRALPPATKRYDVVIASDVLYERAYGNLVADAIAALLAPDAVALLADPGRVGRDEFLRGLPGLGLEVRRRDEIPFVEGPIRQTITVFEIVWA